MKSAYCIRIEPTDESGRLKWQLITGQCASYSFYCKNHLRWKFNGTYYILFWFRLTVVDTPGFGDAIDNSDSFQQIIRYIDDQFARYRTLLTGAFITEFLNWTSEVVMTRVVDPDPDWIRIQSGLWILIRIRNPDPGGQKWPTKVDNNL